MLTDEARKLIAEVRPALIATASEGGRPNVSAKGSLRVIDDDTVAFADVASPRTIANIKENPQVSIICLDAAQRRSCRLWGTAQILTSGNVFDEVAGALAAQNIKANHVVKVRVTAVETT